MVGLETFVDAAQYGRSGKFAVTVVSEKGALLSAALVGAVTADVAQQVAVAAFASGMIANQAAALLRGKCSTNSDYVHYITWFPAHMGDSVLPGCVFGIPRVVAHARRKTRSARGAGRWRAARDTPFREPAVSAEGLRELWDSRMQSSEAL
ncbi:hypothetical protein HPB50_028395 [Hyalomma asiaticum]|nr:hypothetical protein HPB50_028395 [Hyalomma asiaticum]